MAFEVTIEAEDFFEGALRAAEKGIADGFEVSREPGIQMLRSASPVSSGTLRNAWTGTVETGRAEPELVFENRTPYASFVDAREPFVDRTIVEIDERQVRPNVDDKMNEAFRAEERR